MASLTIRNLEADAQKSGYGSERPTKAVPWKPARAILEAALAEPAAPRGGGSLVERIHGRFATFGGIELELPPREAGRSPPEFD